MISQYLFGGVKSCKVLCPYPIREPHGFISDYLGQRQVTGTVIKIIYTQQVMPTCCMLTLNTATRLFILRNFIVGNFLFAFRLGVEPFLKSPLEFFYPFFLAGHFFSPFFAFVCSCMFCQCTPPLWLNKTLYHGEEGECSRPHRSCLRGAG